MYMALASSFYTLFFDAVVSLLLCSCYYILIGSFFVLRSQYCVFSAAFSLRLDGSREIAME